MDRRPAFAQDFPRAPELDALVDAFARGDYARVRADAPKLEASAPDEAVRRAARTLVRKTKPDPLAIGLLALAAVLLVALSTYAVVHGRPAAGTAPRTPPLERAR
ncbi:MAG TPA: hypothetical protein VE987_20060 [Polyangiaceae bacterium]|nr:hypothetical protein [Polyangiaceae bacterium]